MMIKTFIMLQNISISDKCCSSELSIHQRNLKKIYSAVFIIHNINNNNNKCILSSKSEYLNDSEHHVTGVMMLKIQL